MNNGRRGRKYRRRGTHNPCTYCGRKHGELTPSGVRWGKKQCYTVRKNRR